MVVKRMDFARNPFIGAFSLSTDKFAIFPLTLPFKKEVASALGVSIIKASISKSPLLGVLMAGNSNGVLCSEAFEVEFEKGEKVDLNIGYLPGKHTALGNMILANDYGALISPEFPDSIGKLIGENLGVRVKKGTIAGFRNVGAVGIATNNGALLHPDASQEEINVASEILGVPVDIGTACSGTKFVGLCVIANSRCAIAGATTTGPELGRIESALNLLGGS
ncbi:MAG: translation initiation factor IF-6 [Candidatus Hadarchaeales archaeon]